MMESQTVERPAEVFVAPCAPNTLRIGPEIRDVLVLVPSTSVAESYRPAEASASTLGDPSYWWEWPEISEVLEEIESTHRSLSVLRFEGWLGEASMDDIASAGSALRELLLEDFSEAENDPVHFHFFAYREGAAVVINALNEATAIGGWPASWRVRSVVLSSPRIRSTLHQLRASVFHPRCTVTCVTNPSSLESTAATVSGVECLLHHVPEQTGTDANSALGALDIDIDSVFNALQRGDARAVARGVADWLEALLQLISVGTAWLDQLPTSIDGEVGASVTDKVQPTERPLVPDVLSEDLRAMLDALREATSAIRDALHTVGSMEALDEALGAAEFFEIWMMLDVSPATLRGPIWDILARIVASQSFWHDALVLDLPEYFARQLGPDAVAVVEAHGSSDPHPRLSGLRRALSAVPTAPVTIGAPSRAAELMFALLAQCGGVPVFVARHRDWAGVSGDALASPSPLAYSSLSTFANTVGTLATVLGARMSSGDGSADDVHPPTGGVRWHLFAAPARAVTHFPTRAIDALRAQLGPLHPPSE